MKIAIVVSQFNPSISEGLLSGAVEYLATQKMHENDIKKVEAPGAFETPLIAKALAKTGQFDGIICLGSVIKGETAHFEYISLGATMGLSQASLDTEVPISFGILTTYNREQAENRSQPDSHNKGLEAAKACLDSIRLLRQIRQY